MSKGNGGPGNTCMVDGVRKLNPYVTYQKVSKQNLNQQIRKTHSLKNSYKQLIWVENCLWGTQRRNRERQTRGLPFS